jgi:hypothetical protein
MRRRRRHNPGLGFLDPVSITAIATGISALVPVAAGLFASKPKPESTYDPTAYARDLQAAIALKTQQAAAQQQVQAAVEIEQIKSDSTRKMLLYGSGVIAVTAGVLMLLWSLKRKRGGGRNAN